MCLIRRSSNQTLIIHPHTIPDYLRFSWSNRRKAQYNETCVLGFTWVNLMKGRERWYLLQFINIFGYIKFVTRIFFSQWIYDFRTMVYYLLLPFFYVPIKNSIKFTNSKKPEKAQKQINRPWMPFIVATTRTQKLIATVRLNWRKCYSG